MDKVKSHSIATMTQSIKAQYLIKLTQLLVSVSVCSFIYSPSSLLAFIHYFNFYFSTFPFQLFTHTIDKNCMFLLCNGLLVFVGITKSFSGSSGDEPSKYIDDGSESQFSYVEGNKPMLEKETEGETFEPDEHNSTAAEHTIEIKHSADEEVQEDSKMETLEDEEEKDCIQLLVLEEEEEEPDEETGILDAADEEKDEGSEINYFLIEEKVEDDEVEEEENWTLSTEELNKKFDDFIRKMKEDLRFEARRQLVMV